MCIRDRDYFDPQKGIFIFTEGCSGIEIDERRLAEDILSAIRENRLDAVIPVHSADAAPPLSKACLLYTSHIDCRLTKYQSQHC